MAEQTRPGGRLYAGEWSPAYGSPHLLEEDPPGGGQAAVWEHPALQAVDCPPAAVALAFVDGVRRVEASLFHAEGSSLVPGIAGCLAVGAVVPEDGGLAFGEVRVERLCILGGGRQARLPGRPGGWRWEPLSIAEATPDAPLQALQQRMRTREVELARRLEGLVVLDGPLHGVRGVPEPLVGYVKTHHRQLLGADDHGRVADLAAGQRTSLFQFSERSSCYFRLAPIPPDGHPWYGIVRLEVSEELGRDRAVEVLHRVCGALPRYAGVPHADPRAPQNLQPVGALERELRRRCGDPGLALRAVREAVRHFTEVTHG